MSNLLEIAVGALDKCQQPDTSAPRLDYVLREARNLAGILKTRAKNVGFNWEVRSVDVLFTSADTAGIILPQAEPDERPVFITTYDPADVNHVTRNIEITDPQNVRQYYQGAPFGSMPVVFSHWRTVDDGSLMLKPHPLPQNEQGLQFQVWLERGTIPALPSSNPLSSLGGFDFYLETALAHAILPMCEWSRLLGADPESIDPLTRLAIFREYREPMASAFQGQIAAWDKAFRGHINNGWQQQGHEPRPYGEWAVYDFK